METYLTYRLAISAFERRDYAAAIGHLRSVLDEAPDNLDAREYLARAHYHRAALPAAEEEARRILEQDPTDEYAMLLLARVLERGSRHDEAAAIRRQLAAVTGDENHLANHSLV